MTSSVHPRSPVLPADGANASGPGAHSTSGVLVADEIVKLFVAIVESTDDAMVSKTLEGIITTWNPAAQRMFGYTAPEAVGRSIEMLIPPDRIGEEPIILSRI